MNHKCKTRDDVINRLEAGTLRPARNITNGDIHILYNAGMGNTSHEPLYKMLDIIKDTIEELIGTGELSEVVGGAVTIFPGSPQFKIYELDRSKPF